MSLFPHDQVLVTRGHGKQHPWFAILNAKIPVGVDREDYLHDLRTSRNQYAAQYWILITMGEAIRINESSTRTTDIILEITNPEQIDWTGMNGHVSDRQTTDGKVETNEQMQARQASEQAYVKECLEHNRPIDPALFKSIAISFLYPLPEQQPPEVADYPSGTRLDSLR